MTIRPKLIFGKYNIYSWLCIPWGIHSYAGTQTWMIGRIDSTLFCFRPLRQNLIDFILDHPHSSTDAAYPAELLLSAHYKLLLLIPLVSFPLLTRWIVDLKEEEISLFKCPISIADFLSPAQISRNSSWVVEGQSTSLSRTPWGYYPPFGCFKGEHYYNISFSFLVSLHPVDL
jgi:hypothetical protein